MKREEAIARLRERLIALTDDDTCMCKAAADGGLFCHGFARFNDAELRERYAWIVRKRPRISRDELESIANHWQLAQQQVEETPLACDVQTRIHDTCRGFDDFTNEQLVEFYRELTGEQITVA